MLVITLEQDLRIRCTKRDEFNLIFAFSEKKLTFDNPAYIAAQNSRSYWLLRSIPRYILGYTIHETDKILILPRGFWHRLLEFIRENHIRYTVTDKQTLQSLSEALTYQIGLTLRPYQLEAVSAAVDAHEGIIDAPCGSGKTQMLTEIVRRLNQTTLILVHTDDLLQQMKERIEEAFGIEVGVIKQKEMNLQPITIGSIMTLKRRIESGDLDKTFFKLWGCVMLDEAHHMPAESFSLVVKQFSAYYRYGTTATTIRSDGLHGLMFSTIGYRVYHVPYRTLYAGGYLMKAGVKRVFTNFDFPIRSRHAYQQMLKALKINTERNNLIVDNLIRTRKHNNLVLSSHIDHLQILHGMLIKRRPDLEESCRMLIGRDMTKTERRAVLQEMRDGKIRYIFATQLADEGLDLPVLDRLHLVFPTRAERKVQQQLGRIQRTMKGKKNARVYDYVDASTTLRRQASSRLKVFQETGCYIIQEKNMPQTVNLYG